MKNDLIASYFKSKVSIVIALVIIFSVNLEIKLSMKLQLIQLLTILKFRICPLFIHWINLEMDFIHY